MAQGNFIRTLRQLLMFTVLVVVLGGTYLSRARSTTWEQPLWVGLYPISADDRRVTNDYIAGLDKKSFASIETFMRTEAQGFGIGIDRPVRLELGNKVTELPPEPPERPNPLTVMFWSLQLRWWAYQMTKDQPGAEPHIKMFLVYHDPEVTDTVPHSLGMKEGMIGVAHLFAKRNMRGSNKVVIAHEMLHTLGATDKYGLVGNFPKFPSGYAEPERKPRHPQRYAEIMGGRIPLSKAESSVPSSLKKVRVGAVTAAEISWTE